jgi:hypothetical protein
MAEPLMSWSLAHDTVLLSHLVQAYAAIVTSVISTANAMIAPVMSPV